MSDLHFGTESRDIVRHLVEAVQKAAPDLIVISGDFTQIANQVEFQKAQDFIKSLPAPVFSVPGNHDISRYNIWERLFNPFKKYKKFITSDLLPVISQNDFVIVGINTARPILPHWNWANGAISRKQLIALERAFAGAKNTYRICVLHHPIHKAEKAPLKVTVFGVHKAMEKIHKLNVDIVLTGHVHFASITSIDKTLFVSASTAISSRLRLQENGFNVIDLYPEFFKILHFIYKDNKFVSANEYQYKKSIR